MSPTETCCCLATAETTKVAIVLDASQSAQKHQADVAALARSLVTALPASVSHSIYFLGNPAPYPTTDLDHRIGHWFDQNRQRTSLITPIYQALRDAENTRIVVVGSGRIFDLEDWAGTLQVARTLLVSLGEPLQAALHTATELTNPTPQDLCRHLYDPPVSVEISGPGFMPIRWDNPGYRLALSRGRASLVAEQLQDYAIALQCFVAAGADSGVTAMITRASGAHSGAALEPAAPPPPGVRNAGLLTQSEMAVFRKAVRRQSFSCPVYGAQCSWDTLRCRCQGDLSHLVYPSVEAQRVSGFVLLRDEGSEVSFTALGSSVLRLGAGRVVVKAQDQAPAICYFDPRSRTWVQSQDSVEPYLGVEQDVYAIVV